MTALDPYEVLRELVELVHSFDHPGRDRIVARARAVLAAPAPVVRTEWRVTGDPGPDYPPYEFITPQPERLVALLRENSAFRRNVKDIRVESRTVTTTPWVPAAQAEKDGSKG